MAGTGGSRHSCGAADLWAPAYNITRIHIDGVEEEVRIPGDHDVVGGEIRLGKLCPD